jgi:protein-S-isoprenylcysteine O-methyltransferase Ste14
VGRRVLIVFAYTALFWVALPVGLVAAGFAIDGAVGWSMAKLWVGALPAAVGLWLFVAGIAAIALRGRGWPIGALPPPKLVVTGPYRHSRHPIYLGFWLMLLGAGLMLGSPGLSLVVVPLFMPVWIGYALVEERGLVRRFGDEYRRLCKRVGVLPRVTIKPLFTLMTWLQIVRVRARGRRHLPRKGPVILVVNHACYVDPAFVQALTLRRVWMVTTAEAFRSPGFIGWVVRHAFTIPTRRYMVDAVAARDVIQALAAGELVCMFVERERSVLGRYLGADPAISTGIARFGVPVIPIGLSGTYAAGPRWTGAMRFSTVRARIGPPIQFRPHGDAAARIDAAITALLDEDPQRVWLEHEDLGRLHVAVWRCPACLDESGWKPTELACSSCGARWQPDGEGGVRGRDGSSQTFADWAAPVWDAEEAPVLEVGVRAWRERRRAGTIEPLEDIGETTLRIDERGLSFLELRIPWAELRSTSTERADTLQIASSELMWQLRSDRYSPFRLQRMIDRRRARERADPRRVCAAEASARRQR